MKARAFVIFTADGARRTVKAPSLRTALRNCADEPKAPIVAVIESGCLPVAPAEDRPFYLVALKNAQFTAPPEE